MFTIAIKYMFRSIWYVSEIETRNLADLERLTGIDSKITNGRRRSDKDLRGHDRTSPEEKRGIRAGANPVAEENENAGIITPSGFEIPQATSDSKKNPALKPKSSRGKAAGKQKTVNINEDRRVSESLLRSRRRKKPDDRMASASQRDVLSQVRHSLSVTISKWTKKALDPLAYLPLAIAAAGSMFVFAASSSQEFTPISLAIATFTTVALGLLAAQIIPLIREKQRKSSTIEERFEALEDIAWELRESEERYRTLAETFGDLLVLRDGEGKITYCNGAYCALLETDKRDVLENQVLPSEIKKAFDPSGSVSVAKKEHGSEIMLATPNGNRWFHWLDLPARDEGSGKTGTLSIARDITVFKNIAEAEAGARQKAEQATRAKSRFLAMVSHEMRTPLNGILGMSKLLAETRLDREQENYLGALSHSGKSLLALINDMLDMTMIEAGRFSLNKRAFSPAAVIRETGEVLSQRAYEKGIELAIYTGPDCQADIIGDPDRFRQVITNLVGNAIKFTSSGGVSIDCRIAEGSADLKRQLIIDVADTGPGISKEDQHRIFSEFERIDNEATRRVDGAGLGLAIARAIAVQLGGSLELAETGRNGSVFRFAIPVARMVAANGAKDDAAPVQYREISPILFVSKNAMEAKAVSGMLGDLGYKTQLVQSPSALRKILSKSETAWQRILFDPQKWQEVEAVEARLRAHLTGNGVFVRLVKPGNAAHVKNVGRSSGDAWLVRPVRAESLSIVIDGKVSRETETPSMISPLEAPEQKRSHAPILLAEDNDINALLVSAALKRHGIAVERVENGDEAVQKFVTRLNQSAKKDARKNVVPKSFDLVLMDMQMPVMGGLEAIQAIRASEKATGGKRVAIHVLSADEQESSRNEAFAAGADGFIVKPVDPDKLVELVFDTLGMARA